MNLHPVSACIAAVFTFVSPALATSFMIQAFPDFVRAAPHIVRGSLHDIIVENGITSDGAKTLYTYATLDIRETLKGPIRTSSSIRVRKLGGTRDGVTLEVPSSPEFIESEDTVLFLGPAREDQSYEVWGLELGKFHLDEESGEEILKGGILEYSREHAGNSPQTPERVLTQNRKAWTLSELRDLAAETDRGIKSAPPPSAQDNPTASEAKELTKTDVNDSTQSKTFDPRSEQEPAPAQSTPIGPLALVGILALAIFYFFKGRG